MKRYRAIWLGAVILFLWISPLAAQYQTVVGGCNAVGQVAPCEYQFLYDGEPVERMAEGQGFVYWELRQTAVSSTTTPNLSVAEMLEARSYPTSYRNTSTHGNQWESYNFPIGIAVEGYDTRANRDQVFNDYVSSGTYSTPDEIYKAQAETYPGSYIYYYLICVTKDKILSYYTSDGPAVEVRSHCFGADWNDDLNALGAFCVTYHPELPNPTAYAGIDTIFTYSNGERGRTRRTTGEAAARLVEEGWYYSGPGNIVASPAVMAVYPDSGHVFNTSNFQGAYFDFDTPVEPYWDLEDMLGITSVNQGGEHYPYAELTNVQLIYSGTRLQFDLEDIQYRSDFAVWVNGLETKGAGSADRFLDGNTDPWGNNWPFYTGINCRPPNGDDYVVHWVSNVGEDPASTVVGFLAEVEVDGVHLQWATESEFNTAYYEVRKWSESDSTWQLSGEISGTGSPSEGAEYLMIDPGGQVGDCYQLFEVEESGRRLPYGETAVLDELPQTAPCSVSEPQVQKWYQPEQYAGAGRDGDPTGVEVLHICPAEWVSAIQPLAYHQEVHEYRGFQTQIVTLEEIGSNLAADNIRNFIIQYDETLQYVMLWGVANRSDPEEEVIPGYYNPCDFGWWNDEYWTDEPFVDRDSDGWGDLIVARMSADSVHDVEVQVDQSITYNYTDDVYWRRQALFLCGDQDYGTCSGQLARQINDDLVSLMPYPLNGSTATLYWSEIPDYYWGREDEAVLAWNSGAHLVCTVGPISTRTCLVDYFSYYFNPQVLDRLEPNGAYPIVLAQSCGTAGFGDGQSPYGPDLAHDMLTADWKGALIWIGYSENTSQLINGFMARKFLELIDMDGSLTAGQIWFQVKQITREEHPEAADQIKMWLFLGDPTIRMRWTDVLTSIPDEGIGKVDLDQNRPNPFNPTTTITFSLAVDCPTELAVYDVAGRKVAQLVDDQLLAGDHQVSWDGSNHYGKRVASGVYFLRLETPDLCLNRKMTLLK